MASTTAIQTYTDAIEYLYSFINWEVERHVRYAPEAMTLERPRRVLEALGNPHLQYPIIHITGTKGKGSVGAMCTAALQASGLRTGLYSSPHLQDYRERFRVGGALISPQDFTALVNKVRPVVEQVKDITWFEVTTAMAFLYFAQQGVEAAVIEVGLGGRLDATNVVQPIVSVITSLSYDHMHLLGNSLAAIAREKGGIIKLGVPVVSAPQPPEALDVLRSIAEERGAPFTLVGRDWLYEPLPPSDAGEHFLAAPTGQPLQPYHVSLVGEHQALNATVALAALDHARQAGVPVTESGVRAGLAAVDWPGRLEVLSREPLLIADAAHNAASARRLRATLEARFWRQPMALVFGASADKDIAGMFDALLPLADVLIVTEATHPRAITTEELEALAREQGYSGPVECIPGVAAAMARAVEHVGPRGLVCVTGSLFVVGEARDAFGLPIGHLRADSQPATTSFSSLGQA